MEPLTHDTERIWVEATLQAHFGHEGPVAQCADMLLRFMRSRQQDQNVRLASDNLRLRDENDRLRAANTRLGETAQRGDRL